MPWENLDEDIQELFSELSRECGEVRFAALIDGAIGFSVNRLYLRVLHDRRYGTGRFGGIPNRRKATATRMARMALGVYPKREKKEYVPLVFSEGRRGGNHLKPAKVLAIQTALDAGMSVRRTAREVGVDKNTVRRYRRMSLNLGHKEPLCACGKVSSHQGWCAVRFAQSPRRQRFMASWGRRRSVRRRLPRVADHHSLRRRIERAHAGTDFRFWLSECAAVHALQLSGSRPPAITLSV